jgi:hypothetical protein
MLALLSWNEEKTFDPNSVSRILISLLKLRRKYIIIRCLVISSRESNLCTLVTRWKTTENNISFTFKMQITGKHLLLLLNIEDSELPLPSTLSRSEIFS